jgi:hypothetical protein
VTLGVVLVPADEKEDLEDFGLYLLLLPSLMML